MPHAHAASCSAAISPPAARTRVCVTTITPAMTNDKTSATSVMAAHELGETGGLPAVLGWAYAGTLGFALVYLGEHYVLDLLAGLALTEAIRAARPVAAPAISHVGRTIALLEQRARPA